jgi:hypothetical protein
MANGNENIVLSDDEAKERVRHLLREAFADVRHYGFDRLEMPHEEYVQVRDELFLFRPEDLHYFIPLVLEELLDIHTGDGPRIEYIEYVLWVLDKKNIGFLSEESRRRAQNDFSYFTRDQARAVYEWLVYAQDWEEWCYDSDSLEGALEYWNKRAEP